MLSTMRKHAGWGLKVILGVTILSFVLFFGFSTHQRGSSESGALQIGEEEITQSQFHFFYNNQYENFKDKFKDGEIPEFLLKSIRQSTERTLVQRSLIGQFAQKLGMHVSDQELAEFIMKEKDFDPVAYKDFLQYFYRQNGFSYEDFVRENLLIQKFQNWAQTIEPTMPDASNKTQWTFETTLLQGKEKKGKGEVKKVGPITIAERQQLFPLELSPEEYLQLFSLTKEKPTLSKPFIKGDRTLLARLVERKESAEKGDKKNITPHLIDPWFEDFASKTKVQSLMPQEAP